MNEATLKQAQASDNWSYYQAKGIKQITRESQADLLEASHAPPDTISKMRSESERYKTEQEDIQKEARKLEQEQKDLAEQSRHDLERHHKFAHSVTILQVAIGLSAIAALIERRSMWIIALVGGIVGAGLFLYSFL
jgi:lipopolysaccharide export LptBFGC system permease protein LptF